MQEFETRTVTRVGEESLLTTNAVIRNTYMLLSMTLIFSALMAYIAIVNQARPVSIGLFFLATIGLQFLTFQLRNSVWGIITTFAFTGFMGYTLGPILTWYLSLSNGAQIVTSALGLTGAIFLGLSSYALVTRKDFSYLTGFLFAGMMVGIVASVMAIFFNIPALHLLVSSMFVLIFAGYIMHETSDMIHGGQRNYILATISLYISIYNIFISLLQILGALGGKND